MVLEKLQGKIFRKMFATIFAFALVAAYAAAELPSYIHICSRSDPNIDQCIVNNINNLKSKICEGIPELNIPPNDPFVIDKINLIDTPDIKLYIRNAEVRGLCEFSINNFHADINTLHYDIELIFNHIRANAIYDFDIRLLVPIAHKGSVYVTTDNIGANVTMDFKLVTRRGTRFTYLSKIKINLDIRNYKIQLDVDEEQSSQLHEIISNFIDQNEKEIIKDLKSALEEIISKRIILISNDIVKILPFKDIFSQ